jgi:hypothetical protein
LVEESLPDHQTEFEAIRKVSAKLGVSPEALRRWRCTAPILMTGNWAAQLLKLCSDPV